MAARKKNDLTWTITSSLTLLASGFIADKVVAAGWKAVTGKAAPKDEDRLLSYRLGEVVVFAVVSGAILSVTRQLTLRQAARWYDGRHDIPSLEA